MDQPEMVQHRVAVLVTIRLQNTSSGHVLQHLNWLSLEDRRKDVRLVMMYKIGSENVVITNTKQDRLKSLWRQSLKIVHGCSVSHQQTVKHI